MTEAPKLKNTQFANSNGSWKIGELETPIAPDTISVGVTPPSSGKSFVLTFKDSNKAQEVESLTLTKLPENTSFALSELPEPVLNKTLDVLESVAKSNGLAGLESGMKARFKKAEDVGLADSKAEATVNQVIGEILKTEGKSYYEEKSAALANQAIDEKSPELFAKSKEAAAQAKANEAAGEDRSLLTGNPRRTNAERADAEALSKSSWAEKAEAAKAKLAKGDSSHSR